MLELTVLSMVSCIHGTLRSENCEVNALIIGDQVFHNFAITSPIEFKDVFTCVHVCMSRHTGISCTCDSNVFISIAVCTD